MPVDECGKFDAVMAARESAAERGWRGDRDVALLAEPAAWLRGNRSRYNFGPDGLNGSSGPKADLNCPCDLSRQPMSSDSKARTNFSKGRSASRTRPSRPCWSALGKPTTSSPDCRKCSRRYLAAQTTLTLVPLKQSSLQGLPPTDSRYQNTATCELKTNLQTCLAFRRDPR